MFGLSVYASYSMLISLGLFETMFIYMVCIIGKIGEILGNYQICQNLTFLDNTALVVTPHVKKYMCNHSFLYDHMFPSVCSPIFPSELKIPICAGIVGNSIVSDVC